MTDAIARRFRRFAEKEVRSRSPLYETLANGVAGDADILTFLAALPEAKQQPNLLLAAMRLVCGTPPGLARVPRGVCNARGADPRQDAAPSHPDQRTGALRGLAACAGAPAGRLALIEVGASAGLCLLPDRYGYAYDGHAPFGAEPRFPAGPMRRRRSQRRCPRIAWRAGLDLNPLDISDDDAWLGWRRWSGRISPTASPGCARRSMSRAPTRRVS